MRRHTPHHEMDAKYIAAWPGEDNGNGQRPRKTHNHKYWVSLSGIHTY